MVRMKWQRKTSSNVVVWWQWECVQSKKYIFFAQVRWLGEVKVV